VKKKIIFFANIFLILVKQALQFNKFDFLLKKSPKKQPFFSHFLVFFAPKSPNFQPFYPQNTIF